MAFTTNTRGAFGSSGGFDRPEIPRDRPPLDLVSAAGSPRTLFLENPCADVPEFEWRILAHPEATAGDFLVDVAPDADKASGVTDAFAKYPRIAVLNINSRAVYLRTDIADVDSRGNTVNLEWLGKGDRRRQALPWDLVVDKLEFLSKLSLGALERGVDLGLPVDWLAFFEPTRYSGGQREVIPDLLRKAELRRDFKMSGDRLLMQGVLTVDSRCADAAVSRWPVLGSARRCEDGAGGTSFWGLLYSPPSGAVKSFLEQAFGKRNPRAAISIENSMLGDVYTYDRGAPIRISRAAKDPGKPISGLNTKYVVTAGMPQPLDRGAVAAEFCEWQSVLGPKPTVEQHIEQFVKLFEDAAAERAGAGSRFLDEKLQTVRSLFKELLLDTGYGIYLPQRVVDAPDMMPPELRRGWSTTWTENGQEKTGGCYHWIAAMPAKVRLTDAWLKTLATDRRMKSGQPQQAQAQAPQPPARQAPTPPPPPRFDAPAKPRFAPAAPAKSALPDPSALPWAADEGGEIPYGDADAQDGELVEQPAAQLPPPARPASVQPPLPAAASSARPPPPPARQAPPPLSAVAPQAADMTPGIAGGRPPPPPPPKFGRK